MTLGKSLSILILLASTALAQAQDAPRLAKLHQVVTGDDTITRQFFGQVVARQTVDLAFQVGGQIVDLPVIEGERVAKDTVIAQLDLEPFELALSQATVQKAQADRTLARFENLQGSAVSQVSVEDARTQAELAALAVQDAERSLRNATLLAPFDALVASRNLASFSTIGAGTPVVRLHDMSELRVEIDVPEVLFQRAGRDPDVELMAKFPASDAMFALEPREFNAETSQIGQTFRITLGMTPPEDLNVLPGASVTVFATIAGTAMPMHVPASAIITGNDGAPMVMVFEPSGADEGTVTAQPVEINATTTGAVQVVAGLTSGQEIVASGAAALADGDTVRRFTGFAD